MGRPIYVNVYFVFSKVKCDGVLPSVASPPLEEWTGGRPPAGED